MNGRLLGVCCFADRLNKGFRVLTLFVGSLRKHHFRVSKAKRLHIASQLGFSSDLIKPILLILNFSCGRKPPKPWVSAFSCFKQQSYLNAEMLDRK